MTVLDKNIPIGRGEVDLLVRDGSESVVVEIRSVTSGADPVDAVDATKRRQVAALSKSLGVDRIDYLGVGFNDGFVDFHWVPGSI